MLRNIVVPSLLLATAACTQASDPSTSAADALTLDSAGTDVQILQVWNRGKVVPLYNPVFATGGDTDLDVDTVRCKVLSSSGWSRWIDDEVDCTNVLDERLAEDGKVAPSILPLQFTLTHATDTSEKYVDPDYCRAFEVRALVKDSVMSSPTFAGVGFFNGGKEVFVEKARLNQVGHSTLKSGEGAAVLRFTATALCVSGAHSSTSGNLYRTFEFKPYARFDADSGSYRVWEAIDGNHRLGRSWPGTVPAVNSLGFDRQNVLLKQP